MAPNFLSKLVKATSSPTHTRDRSDRSMDSSRSSTSAKTRSRAPSSTAPPVPPPPPRSPSPNPELTPTPERPRIPTFITTNVDGNESGADSDSTFPSVTVVPPSPSTNNRDLSPSSSNASIPNTGNIRNHNSTPITNGNPISSQDRTISKSTSKSTLQAAEDDPRTPTGPRPVSPTLNQPQSRPRTPSSSAVGSTMKQEPVVPAKSLDPPVQELRKQSSNRSFNQPPPISISHARAATAPPQRQDSVDSQDGQSTTVYTPTNPIVESPTAMRLPEYPNPPPQSQPHLPPQPSPAANSTYLNSPSRDADSVSLISNSGINGQSKDKKRPWRRTTAARKPTGLASAIAASSLAMANHSLTAAQQAQFTAAAQAQTQHQNTPTSARKLSAPGSPPYTSRSASMSSRHTKSKSAEMSPKSSKPKSIRSAASPHRRPSVSVHSDNNSEYYGDDRPEYYSGLEEGSDDEDEGSESEDDLMDLDLGEDDIPVTGFAVASNKRNADFHELFPSVPEGDYLIEDYGCALQREILIQGRLYISENHICFHANIFGWITDLSIPINEITYLEKKMTAFVIPNGIQITTRRAKYTFASFLSRDTTFDVIYNIWKLERPDDVSIGSSGRRSYDALSLDQAVGTGSNVPAVVNGIPVKRATQCTCGKEGTHFSETALEAVLPGTPDRIHNLIFASGFIKDFMAVNQKLLDIQISDWSPTVPGSKLLTRNMSYIKPLSGSLGPKQTKCEIRDEIAYCDFDNYVTTLTTTRTPEVPSGGVFAVKTRTCIMWASAVSTKVIVTTEVEWTGRSFIKGIIEKSAIDGQKVYHADLEKAMRAYIKEHQSEFIPEGVDPAAMSLVAKEVTATIVGIENDQGPSEEEERKKREHERNQRGLQWAWDTFYGASQVARQSTKGALELIMDGWEHSSPTAILYFIIVILVFSNLWTLMRAGSREEAVKRKGMMKEGDREKWIHGVVTAIWDELGAAKGHGVVQHPATVPITVPGAYNLREEIAQLQKVLDTVEERAQVLRKSLNSLEQLDSMN